MGCYKNYEHQSAQRHRERSSPEVRAAHSYLFDSLSCTPSLPHFSPVFCPIFMSGCVLFRYLSMVFCPPFQTFHRMIILYSIFKSSIMISHMIHYIFNLYLEMIIECADYEVFIVFFFAI